MKKLGLITILIISIKTLSFGQIIDSTATIRGHKIVAYYYDKQDNKVFIHGKLKIIDGYVGKSKTLKFKENDKKVKKGKDDMNSFVIRSDSFTLLRNFDYGIFEVDSDFVEVEEVGLLNVYRVSWIRTAGERTIFITGHLVRKQGQNYLEVFPYDSFAGADSRRERIIMLLEGNEELVNKVKNMSKSTFKNSYSQIFKEHNEWVEKEGLKSLKPD